MHGMISIKLVYRLHYAVSDRVISFRFPVETETYSQYHCVQISLGAHPASYPLESGHSFPEERSGSAKSTSQLHLARKLRTRGAIPPLPHNLHDVVFNYAQELYMYVETGSL
jgi:hypothetical protein